MQARTYYFADVCGLGGRYLAMTHTRERDGERIQREVQRGQGGGGHQAQRWTFLDADGHRGGDQVIERARRL